MCNPSLRVIYYIVLAFSACGGIRSGFTMPLPTAYFPFGLGHLGKGWIIRGTTTRRLPWGGKGCSHLQC